MNRLLLAAALAFTGCFVPVDIPAPDGSVVLPDGSVLLPPDASVELPPDGSVELPPDAGTCVPPMTVDIAPGTTIGASPGCENSPVTIRGPDGGIVSGPGATVTPTEPGVYVIETQVDGGATQQTFVHVDGPLDGGFTRTYVDRTDRGQLYLTAHERLLMINAGEITVYEPDGGFYGYLSTISSQSGNIYGVGIAGNSLWLINDGGLEHYTETASGLYLDDVSTDAIVANKGDSVLQLTDVQEDRATVTGWLGVVEFIWNGNSLDAGAADRLIPITWGAAFIEDGGVFDFGLCTLKAGCQTQTCNPVRTCASNSETILSMQDGPVWTLHDTGTELRADQVMLQMRSRPLQGAAPLGPSRLLAQPNSGWENGFSLYRSAPLPYWVVGPYNEWTFKVPMPQNGSFYFGYASNVVAVTRHYVILREDPFTLRFIPR